MWLLFDKLLSKFYSSCSPFPPPLHHCSSSLLASCLLAHQIRHPKEGFFFILRVTRKTIQSISFTLWLLLLSCSSLFGHQFLNILINIPNPTSSNSINSVPNAQFVLFVCLFAGTIRAHARACVVANLAIKYLVVLQRKTNEKIQTHNSTHTTIKTT